MPLHQNVMTPGMRWRKQTWMHIGRKANEFQLSYCAMLGRKRTRTRIGGKVSEFWLSRYLLNKEPWKNKDKGARGEMHSQACRHGLDQKMRVLAVKSTHKHAHMGLIDDQAQTSKPCQCVTDGIICPTLLVVAQSNTRVSLTARFYFWISTIPLKTRFDHWHQWAVT